MYQALVKLRQPVEDIKPARRYRGRAEFNKTLTKVGYGFLGNGSMGLTSPRVQERLGGHNVIDVVGGEANGRSFTADVLACDFDSPLDLARSRLGSSLPLELEMVGRKVTAVQEDSLKLKENTISSA